MWRHPLNVVPAWMDRGWRRATVTTQRPGVRARFEGGALWPPPTEPLASLTWSVCAELTVLLEAASRRAGALVQNHEQSTLDPTSAATDALGHLGLAFHPDVAAAIAERDRAGTGWAANRVTADEARRWEERLTAGDAAVASEVIRRFEADSAVAAAAWPRSAAVAR